jgi:hypothetical protein
MVAMFVYEIGTKWAIFIEDLQSIDAFFKLRFMWSSGFRVEDFQPDNQDIFYAFYKQFRNMIH